MKKVLSVILSFALALPLSATTYHVSKAGNNSNSGTIGSPWLTINKCLTTMAAGDTCQIEDSNTYTENLDTNPIPNGTDAAHQTTITSATGQNFTLAGEINPVSRDYIHFLNFVVDGTGQNFPIGGLTNNHLVFENLEVKNGHQTCILPDASNSQFLNLNVHNCGSSPNNDHGIYLGGTDHDNIIDGGSYHDIAFGFGIQINHTGGDFMTGANNNTVRNTRIYNNGASGGGGIVVHQATYSNYFYNNLIYNNTGPGIQFSSDTTQNLAANNTIYGGSYFGLYATGGTYLNTAENNILYSNSGGVSDAGTANTFSHNPTSDPSFANAASGNFTLQSGSSAIGAGLDLTSLMIARLDSDFAGTARPNGLAWAVGAYEFNSPALFTIVPGSGSAGSTLNLAFTGTATSWSNGTTVASFSGAGCCGAITVNSTTVSSPTSATVNITLPSAPILGYRTVTMTTSAEVETMVNGFLVTSSSCTPDHLAFIAQPSGAALNASLGPITVGVYDAPGNLCTTATNSITLAKNASATWGALSCSGGNAQAAVSGTMTRSDCAVTTSIGSGAVDATASGLSSGTSSSITISGAATIMNSRMVRH